MGTEDFLVKETMGLFYPLGLSNPSCKVHGSGMLINNTVKSTTSFTLPQVLKDTRF